MTYMRRSGMMKEKTMNKDVRNRRLLLSSYWFYKVFSGANVLKTTLNVLLMEKRSQKSRSKAARSSAAGKIASVSRKSSKTSAVSKDRRGAGLRKVVTKILKSARVF